MTPEADDLLHQCLRDQAERWRKGQRIPVETYLQHHQEFRSDDLRMDFLYTEILLRESHGETAYMEEYTTRFPDLKERIESLFQLHSAFAAPPSTPDIPRQPTTEPAPPLANARYSHFELLGRGGMGTVYKARDLALEREVAIKILNASGENLGWDVRLRKEAGTIARLQHSNIVQIYDVGEDDGRPYLVLEYINGGTLADRLKKELMSPAVAASMMRRIATALHAAHERQIVHRDLKPANILLQAGDSEVNIVPKITDFGLAKILDNLSDSRSGQFIGSVHYMAPEQASGGDVGIRADIYSLGVIFYECVTGRPPYQGTNPMRILSLAANSDPIPPRRLQPDVPRDLEAVILKCLNADPARRYSAALALAQDVERFESGLPTLARPASSRDRATKWIRRNPLATGLAALALAILVSGMTAVFWQWRVAVAAQKDTKKALMAEADQRRKTELNLYIANITQAVLFWENGEVEKARLLLNQAIPIVGEVDHRGWEWHYLDRYFHSEIRVIPFDHWCNAMAPVPGSGGMAVATGTPRMNSYHQPSPEEGRAAFLSPDPFQPLQPGPPLPSGATAVAIDARHGRVAWGTPSGHAVIANASDSKVLRTIKIERDIIDLGFCAEGKTLLIGDVTGMLFAYDVESGEQRNAVRIWAQARTLIAVSPDQRSILVGGGRDSAKICDASDLRVLFQLPKEAEGQVTSVAWSLDGTIAYTGRYSGSITGWNAADGTETRSFKVHSGPVYALACSPDGRCIASAGSDRTIRLWDSSNGRIVNSYRGHTATVRCLGFSENGSELYSGGQDATLRIWNAKQDPRGLHLPFTEKLNNIWAGKENGRLDLKAVETNGRIRSWRWGSYETIREATATVPLGRAKGYPVNYTAFVKGGRWVAGIPTDDRNCIAFWDFTTGRELRRSPSAKGRVMALATNDLGTGVVWSTMFDDKTSELHVWKNDSETPTTQYTVPCQSIRALAADRDFSGIVALGIEADRDRGMAIWSCQTNAMVRKIRSFDESAGALAFSPDGSQLAAGADDQIFRFTMPDAKPLDSIKGVGSLTAVAFSPDRRRLASVGYNGVVSISHVETGQVLFQLPGLSRPRPDDQACDARVVFTPDGKTLVSTNWDGSVNVWNGP